MKSFKEFCTEENTYAAFHNGKTHTVTASSSYEAQKKAIEHFKPKKSQQHMVHVHLAQKDGEDVVHTATESVNEARESTHYHSVWQQDKGNTKKWHHHFDADNHEDARCERDGIKNCGYKAKILRVPKDQADWRKPEHVAAAHARLNESRADDIENSSSPAGFEARRAKEKDQRGDHLKRVARLAPHIRTDQKAGSEAARLKKHKDNLDDARALGESDEPVRIGKVGDRVRFRTDRDKTWHKTHKGTITHSDGIRHVVEKDDGSVHHISSTNVLHKLKPKTTTESIDESHSVYKHFPGQNSFYHVKDHPDKQSALNQASRLNQSADDTHTYVVKKKHPIKSK